MEPSDSRQQSTRRARVKASLGKGIGSSVGASSDGTLYVEAGFTKLDS